MAITPWQGQHLAEHYLENRSPPADIYIAPHQILRSWMYLWRATAEVLEVEEKKAQPEEVALKVPPKEEVLEECASARWAATHLHCSKNPNPMQALSAAMRHNMDLSK